MVDSEYIYYRDDNMNYSIFKMRNTNATRKLINDDGNVYDRFIVYKDWIYLSDGITFKRQNLKDSKVEIICKGEIMEIGVCPNYILYRSVKIDKDGNKYDKTTLRRIRN